MDLTVETKDYVFSVDGIPLLFVDQFISNKSHGLFIKEGTVYHLTRKELNELIVYMMVKKREDKSINNIGYLDFIIDRFVSMEMLMCKNEKAEFRFY